MEQVTHYLEEAARCRRLAAATCDLELQTRLLELAAENAAKGAALMAQEPKPKPEPPPA